MWKRAKVGYMKNWTDDKGPDIPGGPWVPKQYKKPEKGGKK